MVRRELHLPLACALIGVLWAICWCMIYRQSELDRTRVHLEQSVPLAVAGLVCGAAIGWALQAVVAEWPALTRLVSAFLIPVLGGSIAAPFGWFARDANLDWSGETAILRAAAWGAVGGLAVYATICVFRAVGGIRGRSSTALPSSSHSAE